MTCGAIYYYHKRCFQFLFSVAWISMKPLLRIWLPWTRFWHLHAAMIELNNSRKTWIILLLCAVNGLYFLSRYGSGDLKFSRSVPMLEFELPKVICFSPSEIATPIGQLFFSTLVILFVCTICHQARKTVDQWVADPLIKILAQEAVAAADLCGCCFELIVGKTIFFLYPSFFCSNCNDSTMNRFRSSSQWPTTSVFGPTGFISSVCRYGGPEPGEKLLPVPTHIWKTWSLENKILSWQWWKHGPSSPEEYSFLSRFRSGYPIRNPTLIPVVSSPQIDSIYLESRSSGNPRKQSWRTLHGGSPSSDVVGLHHRRTSHMFVSNRRKSDNRSRAQARGHFEFFYKHLPRRRRWENQTTINYW